MNTSIHVIEQMTQAIGALQEGQPMNVTESVLDALERANTPATQAAYVAYREALAALTRAADAFSVATADVAEMVAPASTLVDGD